MNATQSLRLHVPFLALACSLGAYAHAAGEPAIPAETLDPALQALLPEAIRTAGVIHLATDAHYPPCESFAADNKTMIGYEPDLWNAMGEKLGVKVEPTSIAFDGLIPGVQSGRYDMAMECISDSPEREKQVTFVDFSYATNAFYALKNNAKVNEDPLSLCGLTAAVQSGTDFAPTITELYSPHCVNAGKAPIKLAQYPSADAVLMALYSGRADFVVNDAASAKDIEKAAPKPIKVITSDLMPKFYLGIVIKRENTDLANAMLAALKAVHASGNYDRIMEKWDLAPLKLPNPGINLTATQPLQNPKP
ncbi:ABC transporter substrate-binding protein [Pseudomonas typographi]|uniref:ABC transporter substrate-binding protein n=1 Tax=Pseudomonas typographi TaxID=2715964 RepID=UPI0016837EC5|nr:ABC transporter substrate-binding protein [Pseudomonas typographi]MBD1554735.1 ABC transporter substrate-binding protein [Pseudomonas typographi]